MIEVRITEMQSDRFEAEKTDKVLLVCDEDSVTITIEQTWSSRSITVDRREFLAAVSCIIQL